MHSANSALMEGVQAAAGQHPALACVLVEHGGDRVLERYFDDAQAHELYPLRSVTKSVLASVFGVAWDEGLIGDVAFPIADAFPEYTTLATPMYEHGTTTYDVLTMTAGYDWPVRHPFRESRLNDFRHAADWVAFAVNLPIRTNRIGHFGYCSPASHLLSSLIQRATGGTAERYAADRLFAPLGIEDWRWEHDPQGVTLGGWGLHLSGRDLLRIGAAHLPRERGNVLSPAWVDMAARAHTTHYGYHWWVRTVAGHRIVFAAGTGGQYLVIVPVLDLVAVILSRPDHPRRTDPWPLFEDTILPVFMP